MAREAVLALANGSVFRGRGVGADGIATGEVVFNTAITGYQEILTDPPYARQIITLTHPHIGNTGINDEDDEARRSHAAGLVVRDVPRRVSNYRARRSLGEWLAGQGIVAIGGVDTRRLTRVLREQGAQKGCILVADPVDDAAVERALMAARDWPGMSGLDLAREVTATAPFEWRESVWQHGSGHVAAPPPRHHVVACDFGVKRNILRMLAARGCRLTVVPATTPAQEILALEPDGIFLSNGPGDPSPCDYAIAAIRALLPVGIPMFGICLGMQLLALACGARTRKMAHGHHGANHPVQDVASGVVMITSQNHGFCVDDAGLPDALRVTHRSLFDGTLQGIRHAEYPAFGFQGHPEASPGPHDAAPLFDHFIDLMAARSADVETA